MAMLPFFGRQGFELDRSPQGRVVGGAERSQSAAQLGARRSYSEGTVRVPLSGLRSYHKCEGDKRHVKERETHERDCAMAVSQPRPPDRVDAALEKVAPLRYLKAHECARTERVVTRFYLNPLSLKNSLLSLKRKFARVIEENEVLTQPIQR
ncbi:hypothetical protein evm_001785 [Chilo suppressalis]|nr:hypothetical protein evm_001785 [Chilo suppressalis]